LTSGHSAECQCPDVKIANDGLTRSGNSGRQGLKAEIGGRR